MLNHPTFQAANPQKREKEEGKEREKGIQT